jgi:hypothetical protein
MGIMEDWPNGKVEHNQIAALNIPVDARPRDRIRPCVDGVWSARCHLAALVDVFRLMAESDEMVKWAERGEVAVCAYVELDYVYEQLLEIENGLEEEDKRK